MKKMGRRLKYVNTKYFYSLGVLLSWEIPFVPDSDNVIPIDFKEVTISRKLYRTGEIFNFTFSNSLFISSNSSLLISKFSENLLKLLFKLL